MRQIRVKLGQITKRPLPAGRDLDTDHIGRLFVGDNILENRLDPGHDNRQRDIVHSCTEDEITLFHQITKLPVELDPVTHAVEIPGQAVADRIEYQIGNQQNGPGKDPHHHFAPFNMNDNLDAAANHTHVHNGKVDGEKLTTFSLEKKKR